MSILIKGMKMPRARKGFVDIRIFYDGEAVKIDNPSKKDYAAVEVPEPHGRLIDANELCGALMKRWDVADEECEKVVSQIMAKIVMPIVAGAPTVIEAEEKDESRHN